MTTKKLKVSNVPNLRFPGFEGEWEEKRLGDMAEKINSGKTPLGGETVYTNEGVLFIRSQNVNNDKLDLTNSVFISENVNAGMKNSVVNPNDVLLNITGASLGRSCVVPNDFTMGNVNQHVCIIRLSKEYNPRFIQPILASSKGQNIFLSLQTGSGREGLNFESIKGINICTPELGEQEKIAHFLGLIQDRIETQNKIIEDLKLLKHGICKKIFTQKFRLPKFSEKWKIIKLGNVLTIPEKIKPVHIDKNKLLTVKLHLKGVEKNNSSESLSLGATTYYVRKKGQFIYGKQNLFNGALGLVSDEFDGFLSSGDVPTLDINYSKVDSLYLLYLIGQKDFYKRLEDIAIGSGSKRIHEAMLLNVEIPLPSLEEQKEISCILSAIDKKIEVEIIISKLLGRQKQYLLQSLFI